MPLPLTEAEPVSLALPPAPPDNATLMFERLAADPNVDVAKLEKLIDMQERILRYNAESAFNAAFSRMQSELPEVDERGQIMVKGQLRSTYAKLEDIHAAVKPILKTYGFAIRHRTEWPADKPNVIRVVGILSHEQGHREESVFEAPADKSDYRSDIQSMGSTVSYGRRYTTLDLLNIATRGEDKDGQKTDAAPQAPDGYQRFLDDLTAVADEGYVPLETAFKAGKVEYRQHLTKHQPELLAKLKTKARGVK